MHTCSELIPELLAVLSVVSVTATATEAMKDVFDMEDTQQVFTSKWTERFNPHLMQCCFISFRKIYGHEANYPCVRLSKVSPIKNLNN